MARQRDQDCVLPTRLLIITPVSRVGSMAKVTLCSVLNFDEKVPSVRGFMTSTGSSGINLNV